ncbi:MAG: hypothetical protein ABMA14_12585 [Hyphomonadaceae bacterium]
MTRQYQINVAPLWKLAGFALLLLSFSFTSWMLGNAAVAVDHLLDATAGFFQSSASVFQPDHPGIFAN